MGLNSHGQLGVGFDQNTTATLQQVNMSTNFHFSPSLSRSVLFVIQIEGLKNEDIVQISAGWQHTLALSREGYLFAWGHGLCGQLGLGHFHDTWDPEEVMEAGFRP